MSKFRFGFRAKYIHHENNPEVIKLIGDNAPFAVRESYNKLCTNIMYLPSDTHCKKIVITSAMPGEGKTVLSVNMARTLVKTIDYCKVLLIDCDLRCSRINKLLIDTDESVHGLSEYLAGLDEVPNIIKDSNNPNLSILTAGANSPSPAGLIASDKMAQFLKDCEESYDYIIIDTPPVGVVSDALLFADKVSGYIISVRADYSNINQVNEVIESIKAIGGNVYGSVLCSHNPKRKEKNRSYYYGYNR